MDKYFTIIDAEKRIGACDIYDIPGEFKKRISKGLVSNTLAELTFFYDDERDFIIFNQEHELFEPYHLFVMDLLEFTDKQLVELTKTAPKSLLNVFEIVLQVMKVRQGL